MCQSIKKLLDEIQIKREVMIDSAKINGFTSEDTIRYSQELDKLIYEYQCVFQEEVQQNEEIKIVFKQMMMIWPKALVTV